MPSRQQPPPDYDLSQVPYLTGDDPRNVQIHGGGRPILALMPATSNTTLPGHFRLHRLVAGRYFYAIPQKLLEGLVSVIGEERFDPQLLELERAAADICGDCARTLGFLDGVGIAYQMLHRSDPMPITEERARNIGINHNQAKLNLEMRQVNETSDGFRKPAVAYLGWLLTTPGFLSEHDELLRRWVAIVQSGGLARYRPLQDGQRHEQSESTEPVSDAERFIVELAAFLARWKIQSLAAPYLPIPWQPTVGNGLPPAAINVVSANSVGILIPDTMPVPSRDNMRRMLDRARRGQQRESPHLQEWYAAIASDNSVKNQFDKFERWFKLQHFWRTIWTRHREAMQRQTSRARQELAQYLQVGAVTVERDLKSIRKRCGADWDSDNDRLSIGPF